MTAQERLRYHREERSADGEAARLDGAADHREAHRAQLHPGRGDRVHAEALGETHAVLEPAGCPLGQQRRGTGSQEGHPPSEERAVLQDGQRGARRGPVHEPDPYLRDERGRSV